ncbi:hypothetical protein JCM9534A_62290 [Catenuloplanes indicus JCM 9534]
MLLHRLHADEPDRQRRAGTVAEHVDRDRVAVRHVVDPAGPDPAHRPAPVRAAPSGGRGLGGRGGQRHEERGGEGEESAHSGTFGARPGALMAVRERSGCESLSSRSFPSVDKELS